MNLCDIIKKCTELPDISIKYEKYSTELILHKKEGKSSMIFFPLFPGLSLAYIFVNSSTWPVPDFSENGSNKTGPLLLNYCVAGRCEIALNTENFVYVKEHDFSLTERFAQKPYQYPRHIYEGLEFFIDIDTVMTETPWLCQEFGIDFYNLAKLYCPDKNTYICEAPSEIRNIFEHIWNLFSSLTPASITQMKIYTLSVFSYLSDLRDIPPSQVCTFLTETQAGIAKRAEKIITSDLRVHHPVRELSARFSVSETSLKNYFRGVFGQNISVYLREVRMKKAAELFIETKLPVSEIAMQVGYMNQSKFAAVFKKQFGLAPLEYRRLKHLEHS